MAKNVLYISASLGLGHIVRDLAIAKELRRQNPRIELYWLAAHPANLMLRQAGERLLPEADMLGDVNIAAEQAAQESYRLNLMDYLTKAAETWAQNVSAFEQAISRQQYHLVIADEAYEISVALQNKRIQLEAPFVMLFDFIGNDSMTSNPVEKQGTYMWNQEWAKIGGFYDGKKNTALFIGELEDVPDTSLGLLLPNRRDLAKEACQFVGYVLPFDPADYDDRAEIRAKLGYGEEPLVVCSIGGTAIGKELLTLCAKAHPIIRQEIPGLRMILVCGPRLDPKSLDLPPGVEIRGYVPALYEHLAACDLAICQGGGTTTLELTALRRPFLYFPLEEHFEQQGHVAARLARHRAGIKMQYCRTTPRSLAKKVVANLGKEVAYPPIPTDGAQRAARVISGLL